ncbi:MarR family winged helix-turn-helix transcriptional regulator [Arthrobacter sp. RCC_34]|uniref:MarR family winged helix-turn-helix transcriptional regulator n=1 Tax=Arthrobacter sp. RCC_34 TaxID=3239230 RepID=UPI0035245A39
MDSNADTDLSLENQLCFALTVASRTVVQAYRPVLEPLGLTHPQYLVMLALWDHNPLSVKEVSAQLLHEPATISPLLRRLEDMGYVRRTPNAQDARALDVELTAEGLALKEKARAVPPAMMRRLKLTREEVMVLNKAMHNLIEAATAED